MINSIIIINDQYIIFSFDFWFKKVPNNAPGIAKVAAVVDNNTLLVDQTCVETLSSLDQYQWDPNPNLAKEKPKHNRASHMADALRYALYSFETSNSGF